MLARVFEEAGLSTVALALVRDHAERAKPPRALFVPFPLGYALGRPNDPAFQHRVLAAALALLDAPRGPVLADFPELADAPAEVLQASGAQAAASSTGGSDALAATDPADELTHLRGYYERWLAEHGGRTTVGLCGVPQRRFRGLVRFLQAYADGRDVSYDERPADLPVGRFIRYAADDLKAFYLEARMARRPDERANELQRWLWAGTALGRLLVRVAERMAASGDPELTTLARGIAR